MNTQNTFRTGDELHRWLPLPPRYRYNHGREAVLEGDETVNRSPHFRICQNCQEAFETIGMKNVCPHCGYDVDIALETRRLELEMEELNRSSINSFIHTMNMLAWGKFQMDRIINDLRQ